MSKKTIKLHLGNGTVYLEGWTNIDIVGKLAKDHPDIVKHNSTTIENYYKRPFRQNRDNNVTDIIMDIRNLEFPENSAEEILSVNVIDHMKKEEFLEALQNWKKVLKPGGLLIIDVDDRKKQAQLLASADTVEEMEWALRLLYCDHAKTGRTHWWGYTPEYLLHLLKQAGFTHKWTRNDYIHHDITTNFQICVKK
jgi:predicted SAM-dependent methyltransferase